MTFFIVSSIIKKVLESIVDTKEMLNDDELKEIAKDELKTLEEEKENIEKETKE